MAEQKQNANWCESDHPRDSDGKFTDKQARFDKHQSDREKLAAKFSETDEKPKKSVWRDISTEELLKDEYVGKSVGAKFKNYDIRYGDKIVHLVEGTYLRNKQIIAGQGCKRKIDEIDGLVKTYGGNADKWVKVKGVGTVDNDGKSEDIEIHWYEEPSIGKVKLKFKKRK